MTPHEERPGRQTEALTDPPPSKSLAHSLASPTDPAAKRRRWAYGLLRRCPEPPPLYGSREWLELPEGTPAKVGAVVRAAECWARGSDELVDNLKREIDERRTAHKAAEDAEYVERHQAHRAEWSLRTPGKTFAERRAEQLAAVEPRAGDYPGRGSGA